VAVLLFAFLMSSQSGTLSHRISKGIADRIVKLGWPLISRFSDSPDWLIMLHLDYALRKLMHLFIYFTLTTLVASGFRVHTSAPAIVTAGTLLSVLICAVADEGRQYFVSGRGASVGDVMLDMAGAGLALACITLYDAAKRKGFFIKKRKI
jgi:VanZ family protein